MGLRPHARRPIAQARAGSGPRGVHRGAVRPLRSVAPHVGRGVHLQRLAHDPRLLRRTAASRLSGLRSHRGGRRVHRYRGRHRARLRRAADPDAQPRPGLRAQHRPGSGHGRDHRLLGRRCLSRPALAHVSRGHVPEHVARRRGRTEHRPTWRRTDRRVRGPGARRARARPRERPGGRAHPGLQHGVPQVLPGGDRGLRPAVPHRRRRRGCVLAAAGARLDSRLPSGRHGLAPPPQLAAHLLAPADRLRPGGGDARAQVAREIQRPGARALGRPHLWRRADVHARVASPAGLSRRLGRRAVSVALPTQLQSVGFAPPDAGMASHDGEPRGDRGAERRLEAVHARGAAVGSRHRAAGRAGVAQRAPRQISRPPRRLGGPAAAPAAHGRAPPGPAARSAAGPPQRGPHTLAAAWHAAANAALARHDLHLDRALAGAGAAIAHDGGGTPGGRRVRAARGPAHSLGSRGPGRLVRRRPAAHGSGGARRREAADSAPLVARPAAAGTAADALLRRAHARGGARSRLGSRGGRRARRPAVRVAHPGANHRCHGHDPGGRRPVAARFGVMTDLALYRRLLRQARPYWLHLAALFGIGLLASPLALLDPVPLRIVFDSVLSSHPLPAYLGTVLPAAALGPANALLVAIGLLLGVAALTQLQALANRFMQAYVGEGLVLGFRTRLVQHAQRLSLSYHDSKGSADSLYRIQQDAAVIDKIMVEGIIPFVAAAVTLVMMIVVTLRLDWQLALVALGVSPPLFVLSRLYRPRMRRQSRHVKKLESSALAVVQETLGALRVVKAFGQESRETDRFVHRSTEGVAARIRLALMEGRYGVLVGLTSALGTAAVLFIGVRHVVEGVLTVGQLWMALRYLDKLYEPLKTISKKAAGIQSYLASAERAFALLDEQPEVPERPHARTIGRAAGAVAFRHVSFAYGPDRPVLHDVSFEIAPGTRLGIVGATGAGKTTLISLLTRFYDPLEGAILLDGVDLRDYKLLDLRRQFAVVLQDAVLFSLSIAENIAYAAPGATREQVVAAAQAANAHEFIERLPQGYDTQVGERGVKLSGGQRQRIALARAFLKDSPVLILDEPTSSVDAKTESAIVEALERLKQGRTVIVISHRSTTLAGCSAFLTVDGGRVVAQTTPAPVVAPPARTPAPTASVKRREILLAHPAVRAWQQLDPERVVPDRITPAKFKPNKPRPNLTVYRLAGVGIDGAAVIAKRCTREGGRIERIVYERVLPHVPLAGPRYYGTVEGPPDEDVCWLLIGEIEGEKYDMLRPDHRAAAARWLGILHTAARSAADQAGLPDAGPSRYRAAMRATRDLIRAQINNPAFSADDVAFLDGLVARFDELDEDWDRLARACTGLPSTLIHGDFNAKNLRVCTSAQGGGAEIGAFDWEEAGHAVPGIDLAQAVDPSCRIAASPDLATYHAVVRERWPNCDATDVERLATCGAVWRALAVISWDGQHLARPWADAFLPNLRMYEAELTHALDRFGWRVRPGRATGRRSE